MAAVAADAAVVETVTKPDNNIKNRKATHKRACGFFLRQTHFTGLKKGMPGCAPLQPDTPAVKENIVCASTFSRPSCDPYAQRSCVPTR